MSCLSLVAYRWQGVLFGRRSECIANVQIKNELCTLKKESGAGNVAIANPKAHASEVYFPSAGSLILI